MNSSITIAPLAESSVSDMYLVEQQAHEIPWSEATLASCFGRFYWSLGVFDTDANTQQKNLIGFCTIQEIFDEATLMNIGIFPQYQQRGIGKKLLTEVISRLKRNKVAKLLLDVRVNNTNAIKLYRQLGFVDIGIRADYYQTLAGTEDGLLMVLPLTEYT